MLLPNETNVTNIDVAENYLVSRCAITGDCTSNTPVKKAALAADGTKFRSSVKPVVPNSTKQEY